MMTHVLRVFYKAKLRSLPPVSSLRCTYRKIYLWMSASGAKCTDMRDTSEEMTHLSVGVTYLAGYKPSKSPNLWLYPYSSVELTPPTQTALRQDHWLRLSLLTRSSRSSIERVSVGQSHVTVLTTSGEVYSAGLNYFGQRGEGAARTSTDDPLPDTTLTKMEGLPGDVVQVKCGLDHTLLLCSDGRVFACGWSADGQTGVGDYGNVEAVTEVRFPVCGDRGQEDKVIAVYTCSDSSFALTKSGKLFSWGNNEYGQLALPSLLQPQVCVPNAVDCSKLDGKVLSIATGGTFTGFLTSEGSVYIAGYSIEQPELSRTKQENKELRLVSPQKLSMFRQLFDGSESSGDGGSCRVSELHAGLNYMLGMISPSTWLVWGKVPGRMGLERARDGRLGQVADETTRNRCSKFQIRSRPIDVSCGPTDIAILMDTEHYPLEPA